MPQGGFDLLDGTLRDHDGLVAQDVVDVQTLGGQPLRRRQVLGAAHQPGVVLGVDDEDLRGRLGDAEVLQRGGDRLGQLLVGDRELVDDDQLLLAGAQRQRGAQRGLLDLLGQGVLVAARLGAEHRATSDPVRRLLRALARLAGALLLPHLLRRAVDLAHALGRGVAGAALGQLPLDHLPQEVLVDFGREDVVGQVDLADVASCGVLDV